MQMTAFKTSSFRQCFTDHQSLDQLVQRLWQPAGLININLGQSSAPEVEQEILEDVGSYGRQLGRIGDALGGADEALPS
jgi:hypothetical protein